MIIHELTAAQCEEFLTRATIGRLGCARHNQPYVVPVSLYFDSGENCLYSFSTVGRKIHWMRDNPRVCIEVDDIADQFHWTTVLVTGRYEELGDLESERSARQRVLAFFQQQPQWWLPGAAKLASGEEHSAPVVFRIQITSLSGRRAARPPA